MQTSVLLKTSVDMWVTHIEQISTTRFANFLHWLRRLWRLQKPKSSTLGREFSKEDANRIAFSPHCCTFAAPGEFSPTGIGFCQIELRLHPGPNPVLTSSLQQWLGKRSEIGPVWPPIEIVKQFSMKPSFSPGLKRKMRTCLELIEQPENCGFQTIFPPLKTTVKKK